MKCPTCQRELPLSPLLIGDVVAHVRADGSECSYGCINMHHRRAAQEYILNQDKRWDLLETPLDRVLKSFSSTLTAMGVQPGDYLK